MVCVTKWESNYGPSIKKRTFKLKTLFYSIASPDSQLSCESCLQTQTPQISTYFHALYFSKAVAHASQPPQLTGHCLNLNSLKIQFQYWHQLWTSTDSSHLQILSNATAKYECVHGSQHLAVQTSVLSCNLLLLQVEFCWRAQGLCCTLKAYFKYLCAEAVLFTTLYMVYQLHTISLKTNTQAGREFLKIGKKRRWTYCYRDNLLQHWT